MEWGRIERASGLVEWVCEHGIGHPDEQSVIDMEETNPGGHWSIHGCCADRCCSLPSFPGRLKKDWRLLED